MTVLKPKSVPGKGVKPTQQMVLPSSSKSPQKARQGFSCTQGAVLPPVSKGQQKAHSLYQQTLFPPSRMCLQKTAPQCAIQLHLTEYELEELREYKQVWYLGEKANKTCYSKVTDTEPFSSNSSGYDTEEGYYKAIINDHLAYRFEILELIGKGYSGQVFKCMDHKTMELVAIKVFRNINRVHQLGKAEVKILETLREADKNNTANIVHMKESFYFHNHLCVTFGLFAKDLNRALKDTDQRRLKETEIRKYTVDVLKCLQMLRRNRIIHGDIKPDNVLLHEKDGETHTAISDFGASYFVRHRDQPPVHTLYYASPEVLLGKTCSPATDMWSLGCTLAELHLGHRLFRGHDSVEQFSCIMKVLGIPPSELLVEAPKRNKYFDLCGAPLKIKDIRRHRTTLAKRLNSDSARFVDFIQRCLEYDPTKRMTPGEALRHPWITENPCRAKPATSARKTRSDAPVLSRKKKPALKKRVKMPPVRLQPTNKTKAKKGGKKTHKGPT
ncbi:dual specificity tyrosine-phosphorylation-regulated kinase 4-like [Toxotes jaculatrix]|uniref:dual specificity tyrosine-phosphorylation-regulated kinase 4-like n=1 Tax=Toxotes jaculatrix TaxID=941984 RepID=UPI001B3B1A99|nr:dual specificity tyrosine-phosphorylation-regulated kinase 4-like [Toxotes jaculatrix]